MTKLPPFASAGKPADTIDVRLSYKIVELFSENMYASPNKAIEELVANSFDAGAQRVLLLLSPNLHKSDATITVIDDGEGMDIVGLKQHWLIGISNKRLLTKLPRSRQQIGKFGIGKLATYVLAGRLTHVSKSKGKYYSASMDYSKLNSEIDPDLEPKVPIKLPVHELSEAEAKTALSDWTTTIAKYNPSALQLFGAKAPKSWTVAIMSSLKPRVHEIKPGMLEWVLRTALPLRPDFGIWLDGTKLVPSKQGKGLLKKWVLGQDIVKLPKPGPKTVAVSEDKSLKPSDELRYGLHIPDLGRVTGYAEAYKDLLTGNKSDELGRSYGFFVYVFGRLINVQDGHFGIPPNELRHGTFGRFRFVVHMDGLDESLRSNREAVSDGPQLETAQNVLRAVFNAVRSTIEKHDEEETPGARLARKLAASPASLSRRPIVELTRAVLEGKATSRFLRIPIGTKATNADLLERLEERAKEGTSFVGGLEVNYGASTSDGIAQYDAVTGILHVNAWHPFVATFYDEYTGKKTGQPLQLLAMAEVLAEAHLFELDAPDSLSSAYLDLRDQLLRNLANESGRKSAFAIALGLREARNNADALEDKVCAALDSLGLAVTPLGKKGEPDGVAVASLGGDEKDSSRDYKVSLEAKSKKRDAGTVAASTVDVAAVVEHRDDKGCEHALVVGRAFPTTKGEKSALSKRISADRAASAAKGVPKTITLITIDDLAELVRLRPLKQMGLKTLRELFQTCQLPEESAAWVAKLRNMSVKRPDYKRIVATIGLLHQKFAKATVSYSSLRTELSHLSPPIVYDTDSALENICKGMAEMAPGAIFAFAGRVELDQSPENVVSAIETALTGA